MTQTAHCFRPIYNRLKVKKPPTNLPRSTRTHTDGLSPTGARRLALFSKDFPCQVLLPIAGRPDCFAVLFQRSGDLWMVAIFHGLGDSYIGGTLSAWTPSV